MIILVICLIASVIGLIVYARNHSLYWKNRGISGPPSQIFVGNLIQLGNPVTNPLPFQLVKWTKQYGKTYGIQRGHCNALVTSDYKVEKQVFHDQFECFHERDLIPLHGDPDKAALTNVFSARGLRWKRLRILTSAGFTIKNLKRIFPTILKTSEQLCKNLEEDLKTSPVVDIAKSFKEYTADVILRTTFGRYESREFLQNLIAGVLSSFEQMRGWTFYAAWIFPWIGPYLGILNARTVMRSNKALAGFFQEIADDVRRRKKERHLPTTRNVDSSQPTDFIDILMDAESDEVIMHNSDNYSKKNSQIDKRLNVNEVIATCHGFLRAGFETTANTLALTVYYLAKNPDTQDKLRAEVMEHCPNDDLDYDSVSKLKYTDAAFQEAARFWPVACAFISRRCTKTTRIGKMEIEKGTDIILDVMSMHRDKEVFGDDVEEFRPERWLVDDAPHSSFVGFGDGLRICAGIRLAIVEQRVALAKIVRKYRIHEVPETKEAMDISGVILGPKSVKAKLERI
ncbi:CYtochrome P450 family [Aphelenchoides bicaudatus]|nr:CYtochrome P450 family [Aphelenchoides bicaudatus]